MILESKNKSEMIIAGGHSCVSSEQTNARKRVIINLLRILSIHVH